MEEGGGRCKGPEAREKAGCYSDTSVSAVFRSRVMGKGAGDVDLRSQGLC